MVFFELMPKAYFSGRVLLPPQQKKCTLDENPNVPHVDKQKHKRRNAWFTAANQLSRGKQDFEHLFIKRRYSKTTQNIIKNERSSMLSVIANSADVEIYLVDQ